MSLKSNVTVFEKKKGVIIVHLTASFIYTSFEKYLYLIIKMIVS